MKTVLLLICSNVFMTIAWYGHLKYRRAPLITVIVVSWLIAFLEYCFQVPANRIGYGQFSGFQLKIIQEVITLCVFTAFAWAYLGEEITWRYGGAFLCLLGAVEFAFWGRLSVAKAGSFPRGFIVFGHTRFNQTDVVQTGDDSGSVSHLIFHRRNVK